MISKHHNLAMHLGIKVVHNVFDLFGMKSFEAFLVKAKNSKIMLLHATQNLNPGIPDIEIERAIAGRDGESHLFEWIP